LLNKNINIISTSSFIGAFMGYSENSNLTEIHLTNVNVSGGAYVSGFVATQDLGIFFLASSLKI
jgi:hypothetical protein